MKIGDSEMKTAFKCWSSLLLIDWTRLRWALAVWAISGAGWLGCAGENHQDDLDAILQDGELTTLSRHALTPGREPGGQAAGAAPLPAGMSGSAGAARMASDPGPAAPGAPFPQRAQGLWMFDDCTADRADLLDSAAEGHTAFRSLSVACAPGALALGVDIDEADDLVYVPEQPHFTFEAGVTVAAWVKPDKLGGVRTIFRKREAGTSTFVLLSNGRNYQFVVRLAGGRAAAVSAPATAKVFTHVAGTYDGQELRLYLDGALAARSLVAGPLSAGAGPLLMGNDAFGRRLDGTLDSVFFDVSAAAPDQIVKLACIARPSTLVAVPAVSAPVAPGTPFTFDVQLANHDCDPQSFEMHALSQPRGLAVSPVVSLMDVAPGTTGHLALTVASSPDIAPDDYVVSLLAVALSPPFESLSATATYSVAGGPCDVRARKELLIRDLGVVEDPVRTAPGGAWTFGHLMENLAPTAAAAPAMVEAMLGTWLSPQSVGGFTVAARPLMRDRILAPFPRSADGSLDLSHAPFRLLAIANRIDLRDPARASAGEGRFVFGVLDAGGSPLQMTLIVEYDIPAASGQEVADLAGAWHALGSIPTPSEEYNAALQTITDRFTGRDSAPGRVNGSALGQLRTNDFSVLGDWELREFHLSATTGQLRPAPLALTPDRSLNHTTTLADYINANQAAILLEKHTVPESFNGQPFQAGSMITDFFVWSAPGVDAEARARFAENTCNGCHSSPLETGTFVFQIAPRPLGQESAVSPFLVGTQVPDPFAGLVRNFDELGRRGHILRALVCAAP